MTAVCDSLGEELRQDFRRARADLARARIHQALKDTPANRATVTECQARIDAILDMHLQTTGSPRSGEPR